MFFQGIIRKVYILATYSTSMKNIMIRDDVYDRLSTIKGKKSISGVVSDLFSESVDKKRRNLRKLFGSIDEKEKKELGRLVMEVRRVAKSRLF